MAYTHGANITPVSLGENFELQGASPGGGKEFTNYVGQDKLGNFISTTNQQRNQIANFTFTYLAKVPLGATTTIELGGDGGLTGLVITRVAVRQVNNANATVELTCHQHGTTPSVNNHLDTSAFTIVLPSCGYGIVSAPLTLASGDPPDNIVSVDWSAEVQHVDKQNRLGDHLVGASFGCRLDCSESRIDNGEAITAAAGWFLDGDVPSESNADFRTRTIRGHSFAAKL